MNSGITLLSDIKNDSIEGIDSAVLILQLWDVIVQADTGLVNIMIYWAQLHKLKKRQKKNPANLTLIPLHMIALVVW